MVSGATEVGVVPHSPLRVISRGPYVTGRGKRVRTLVTTLGLFEKPEGGDEFWLNGSKEDGKTAREALVQ